MSRSQISPAPARRRWPVEEKRHIVELTLRKNASIGSIAQQFGIHATTLSAWRNLYRDERLELRKTAHNLNESLITTLIPVNVAPPTCMPLTQSSRSTVNINFSSGTSVRIEVDVLNLIDLGALFTAMK